MVDVGGSLSHNVQGQRTVGLKTLFGFHDTIKYICEIAGLKTNGDATAADTKMALNVNNRSFNAMHTSFDHCIMFFCDTNQMIVTAMAMLTTLLTLMRLPNT